MPTDKAGQEQPEAGKEKGEATKNEQRPAAAALVQSAMDEYHANRKKQNDWEKKKRFREWLTIGGLFIAAAAAMIQAYIFNNQLGLTRETAVQQLRAYVFIERSQIENVASGQTPKATIIIKNFGQTPAYDVTHWSAISSPVQFTNHDPFRPPTADLPLSRTIDRPENR